MTNVIIILRTTVLVAYRTHAVVVNLNRNLLKHSEGTSTGPRFDPMPVRAVFQGCKLVCSMGTQIQILPGPEKYLKRWTVGIFSNVLGHYLKYCWGPGRLQVQRSPRRASVDFPFLDPESSRRGPCPPRQSPRNRPPKVQKTRISHDPSCRAL